MRGGYVNRNKTKVEPEGEGQKEQKSDAKRRRLKKHHTVLKGMKDLEESEPDMESTRAQFRICCESPMSSKGAMVFHTLFGIVIILSLLCMCGETLNHDGYVHESNMYPHTYKVIEVVFTCIFAIDLVFRAVVADRYFIKRRYPGLMESHAPFFRDVLNLMDFLSILPLPIDIIINAMDPGVPISKAIRLLSVFRVLRIFKVTRHFEGTKIIMATASSSAEPILVSTFMLISFMFVVSPILFLAEPCYVNQECIFQDAFNSMYYLMITLTTVGYGDQIPTTSWGKVVGVVMMLCGALYMAMPLAIIGTKFDDAFTAHEEEKSMKNGNWAQAQMRKLQTVTRKARRQRALHLGYQIAEEVGEHNEWEETWTKLRQDIDYDVETENKTKIELLCALFEDTGQLALDMNVLFGLNYHETMSKQSEHLAKTKTQDGVSLGGAFWASSDPFSKKADNLSDAEKKILKLNALGKEEIAQMYSKNAQYLKSVSEAAESDNLRDKIWLCTEIPKSGTCAHIYHWLSLIMTLMSILLFLGETMPDYNDYREGGRVCKAVTAYHCRNVFNKYYFKNSIDYSTQSDAAVAAALADLAETTTDDIKGKDIAQYNLWEEAAKANLGCWSSSDTKKWFNISDPTYRVQLDARSLIGDEVEEEYGGCVDLKTDATLATKIESNVLETECHFPAQHLGFSCDSDLRWNSLHEGSNNHKTRPDADFARTFGDGVAFGTKLFHSKWQDPFNHDWAVKENDHETRGVAPWNKFEKTLDPSTDGKSSTETETSICNREQCVSNDNRDWAFEFMLGELTFATWFVVELVLRLVSARSMKTYFRECSNVFDIFAVFVSVAEAVYLPVLLGGALYEVWGNPIGDPAIMRFFRLLVTIRFITMQRHFSGLKVIKLTVKKVAGKMKIPIFFFFVFAVVFASFFYIIESGDLFIDCNEGDYVPPSIKDICGALSSIARKTCVKEYNTNAGVCRTCPEPDLSAGYIPSKAPDYNAVFKYNNTCSNFIKLAGENGMRLAEPKVMDMIDAIWTMIVTMTTVGYGGFFPLQAPGKLCSLAAALFGSFYMAMPLTIVGSKFYEIYIDVEREDRELAEDMRKIFVKKKAKKVVNVDMNLSLAQLSKLKLKSTSAKDRVREMGLHKDEIEESFNYIAAVDQLPLDHGNEALVKFAATHFELMKLMSKHLVHRKKGISANDMNGGSALSSLGGD